MARLKIALFFVVFLHLAPLLALASSSDEEEVATNEISEKGSVDKEDKQHRSGSKKDLKKDVKYLKLQYDEMFQEMKNQNHAILKQADHSRILSLKVVNMTGELALLNRENLLLREKVELFEFKLGKRMKKLKAKSGALGTRLGKQKCLG